MRLTLLCVLPLLAACAPGLAPDAPAVRHAGTTVPFGADARWHLFLFDPPIPRPLDDRLRLARASLSDDPACAWVRAPRDQIVERTRQQGARYADVALANPLRCRR